MPYGWGWWNRTRRESGRGWQKVRPEETGQGCKIHVTLFKRDPWHILTPWDVSHSWGDFIAICKINLWLNISCLLRRDDRRMIQINLHDAVSYPTRNPSRGWSFPALRTICAGHLAERLGYSARKYVLYCTYERPEHNKLVYSGSNIMASKLVLWTKISIIIEDAASAAYSWQRRTIKSYLSVVLSLT